MRLEKYHTEIDSTSTIYEFISESEERSIKKRVIYQQIDDSNIYNLAFGDVDLMTDELDDIVVSNNGDTEKILATVAATIFSFLNKYPHAIIYAKGSTSGRTRLYKIGISNHLEELEQKFMVMGYTTDEKWEIYDKKGFYSAFFIKKIK
jgi:hypothetical protein